MNEIVKILLIELYTLFEYSSNLMRHDQPQKRENSIPPAI